MPTGSQSRARDVEGHAASIGPQSTWYLHATSLRATLVKVPHCAAWLRLLVTALFCVVGMGRALAQSSNGTAEVQANEPMHVSASTREGERIALRKRGADEWTDDLAILVEAPPERLAAARTLLDMGAPHGARLSSAHVERPRARGPPIG